MFILRVLILSGILTSTVGGASLSAQAATAVATASQVRVTLPQEDAELSVDGQTIEGTGTSRTIALSGGTQGAARQHTFSVTWQPNTYTTITRSKTVSLRTGAPAVVDLTVEDPADRVRVIYVPTPADVAQEMVELARVTRNDVVYEPGCGDARITIAAIRAGAQRAICIDIDPDRAEESKANVKKAGLADRIDVRLGDALDLKDLSEVTVVFLYMGDHFNMLIRPVLWRDLKVGSRIVSHRFTMGDWKPDRTISVNSIDGGTYDLHLWTITDDVKRRAR